MHSRRLAPGTLIRWTSVLLLGPVAAIAAPQIESRATVSASPSPSLLGRPVTILAAVAPAASGKVTFYDGTAVLGVAVLEGGQAVFRTSLLPSGTRSLWVHYGGDGAHAACDSAPVPHLVTAARAGGRSRIEMIPAGLRPGAAAAGDFDGNGAPDLATANSGGDDVSVLLNNGDGTFRPAAHYGAGAAPSGIVVGDFNGDGIPDLAVANRHGQSVSVLFNNGDGTFRAAVNVGLGASPAALAAGDFDKDGRADLVVAVPGGIGILGGNGDGTFRAMTNHRLRADAVSVTVADFDGDGIADLAAATAGGAVTVLAGIGDGTFRAPVDYAVPGAPASLAVADLNGDGKPDLAVAGGSTVSVLWGSGGGTFAPAVEYGPYNGAQAVAAGDFDGDGNADLAVGGDAGWGLLLGSGGGVLTPVNYGSVEPVQFAVAADFNGDGRTDLAGAGTETNTVAIMTGEPAEVAVAPALRSGTGTGRSALSVTAIALAAAPNPAVYGQPVTLTATVDPSATGKVTFYDGVTVLGIAAVSGGHASLTTIMLPSGTRSLRAHYGGDTAFAAADSTSVTATVNAVVSLGFKKAVDVSGSIYQPTPLAVGDFNGDGKADVLVQDYYSFALYVLLGNGDGTFGAPAALGVYPSKVALGDFNGDGRIDIALSGSGVRVLPGNGDGTFGAPVVLSSGSTNAIVAADIDGDGNIDLVVGAGSTIQIYLGNGNGTFQAGVTRPVNAVTAALAAGDFNGDGKTDLVLGLSSMVAVMLGNGDGSFQDPVTYSAGSNSFGSIAVEDFNGDGVPDVAGAAYYGLYVWLGRGDGTLQPAASTGAPATVVRTGDVNGDGKPDLVFGSTYSYTCGFQLGNGDGTFRPAVTLAAGAYPFQLATADFNGDGMLDVLVSKSYGFSLANGGAITDLTITSTHAHEFTRGQTGAVYKLVVTNVGDIASSGSVGVVDTLPATGLTATGITGDGWTCVLETLTCTRPDSLAPGASFAPISVTVNVASNAPTSVLNAAAVSGGADANPANNIATDPTVNRLPTGTGLNSNINPAALGQTVTFTATVSGGTTGKVTFYDGTNVIGVASMSGPSATLATSMLPAGARSITARYDGDSVYGPSISPALALTVNSGVSYGIRSTNVTAAAAHALAAGDFNGDGKPDLVVQGYGAAHSCNGSSNYALQVLIGSGTGTFQPADYYCVGTNDVRLLAGDFDGDGKQDLAAFSIYGKQLYVLMGKGDGTFRDPVPYTLSQPDYTTGAVGGDFDGDGILDLAVGGSGFVSVLLGNGDGTFQPPVTTSGQFSLSSVAVGDFNGDGKADLVAVGNNSSIAILLGNGDGSFQQSGTYAASYSPSSLSIADMNRDGKLDVVACSFLGIDIFRGNGNGTFQNPVYQSGATLGNAAAVGDLNGDGKPDVVSLEYAGGDVYIFLGNGDGTLSPPALHASDPGSYSYQIVMGDFDGDGKADLVEGNGNQVSVLLGGAPPGLAISKSHTGRYVPGQTGVVYRIAINNPGFTTVTGTVTVTDTLPVGLTATAISGSGWTCTLAPLRCTHTDTIWNSTPLPDILVTANVSAGLAASTITNTATVSSSAGTNTASDPTAIVWPTSTSLSVSLSSAMLGQPVTLTATVSAGTTGKVTFWDGAAPVGTATLSGTQATLVTRLLPAGPHAMRAEYAGDATHGASRSAAVLMTITAGQASGVNSPSNYSAATRPASVVASDFNNDGKTDFAVANAGAGSISIFLGAGNGTFSARVDYPVNAPVKIAAADFNADGNIDLAVMNNESSNATIGILLGTGTGAFQPAISFAVGSNPRAMVVADFNNDALPDLAIVANYSLLILLGNGDGTFQQSGLSYSFTTLAAGDLDGDGNTDLLGFSGGSATVMLGRGDGSFTGFYYSNNLSVSVNTGMLADLNGDGKLDIIGAGNGVSVALGKGDGTFQNAVVYSSNMSDSARLADVNGDGKLDVVGVYSGTNTVSVLFGRGDGTFQTPPVNYTAGTGPLDLVAADFNGDAKTDLAVANGGSNNITVLLGVLPPVLSVRVSHNRTFVLGETGAVYTVLVSNGGPGVTSGTVTVVDTLPAGLTAAGISGAGWGCTLATLTCTRSEPLGVGGTYPAITVTVNVAAGAPSSVVNQVSVSGGDSGTAYASDPTSIFGATLKEIGVYRGGTWFLDGNGNGSFDNGVDAYFSWWGGAGSVPVKGDWNGSGSTRAGFYKDGIWYLDYNGNGYFDGYSDKVYGFGWAGANVVPITGDWNGDGKTEVGVFSNGFWYLDYNGNGVWDGPEIDRLYGWGWQGVTPLVGDWNGDGRTKIGFFVNGFWYLDYDGNGVWDGGVLDKQYSWGWSAVTPVTGDWSGDGKVKIGFYYNGFWYLDYNGNGVWEPATDKLYSWGWNGTTPVVGDWSGDGKDKVGIFVDGFWYLDMNGNGIWDGTGADRLYGLGQTGDLPLVGRW